MSTDVYSDVVTPSSCSLCYVVIAHFVKKAGTVIHMSMPAGLTYGLILFN